MAKMLSLVFLEITLLSIVTGSTQLEKIGAANNDFAWNLYTEIATLLDGRDRDSNIFFSPTSISTALAMTYAGSREKTASQMEQVLNFNNEFESQSAIHAAFKELIAVFNAQDKNYTLSLANRLFGRLGFDFLQEYLTTANQNYNASMESLDFGGNALASRERINEWVETQTGGKIQNLLQPGTIEPATVLVLVNAIYFKGQWEVPFDPDMTKPGKFSLNNGNAVMVDMMTMGLGRFKFSKSENLDAKILELPYGGREVAMYFVLPNNSSNLSKLEKTLDLQTLNSVLDNTKDTLIDSVVIPKFKLTQEVNMKKLLMDMGMSDLFMDDRADLSGMTGEKGLYVAEVVHKAFVEVNEEDTEAAGATSAILVPVSVREPITFVADKPFLFFIKEKSSGSILFMGRFASPPRLGREKPVGEFGEAGKASNSSRLSKSVQLAVACFLTTFLFQ